MKNQKELKKGKITTIKMNNNNQTTNKILTTNKDKSTLYKENTITYSVLTDN